MPRVFAPPHAQELRHGGRPVTDDGIDVPEIEVADLLADGWTMSPPARVVFPEPVTDHTADVAAIATDEEEPQS